MFKAQAISLEKFREMYDILIEQPEVTELCNKYTALKYVPYLHALEC